MNIREIEKNLIHRRDELNRLIDDCSKTIDKVEHLHLYAVKHNNTINYYKQNKKTGKRTFVKKGNSKELMALQTINYYKKLIKTSKKQLKAVEQMLKQAEKCTDPEAVFTIEGQPYTSLIKPYKLPDSEKITFFNTKPKQRGMAEAFTYKTKAGEFVRSKSELIIADKLFDYEIPYAYEKGVELGEIFVVEPDFTVLNKRTGEIFYWEHLGMMDKPEYCRDAQIKVENYTKCSVVPNKRLIITFESSLRPLSTEYIENTIKEYLL